jgi:hypothetical protein
LVVEFIVVAEPVVHTSLKVYPSVSTTLSQMETNGTGVQNSSKLLGRGFALCRSMHLLPFNQFVAVWLIVAVAAFDSESMEFHVAFVAFVAA